MGLSQSDSLKINYKAKIDWYKERMVALSQGFVNPSMESNDVDADKFLANIDDLRKKSDKLSKRIDDSCAGLKIPVDKVKDQAISESVMRVDPESGGLYVSYETYKRLAEQIQSGVANIQIDDIIINSSNDQTSNSKLVQDRLYSGYAKYTGTASETKESNYDEKMLSWNDNDYDIRSIIDFSDSYLSTYPEPAYEPWAFKGDVMVEQSQLDGFRGLWNGFSEAGKEDLKQFDGSFKNLSAIKPDKSITGVTERYLTYANDKLNAINKLFGTSWTADMICCFMKYVVRLDPKTVKAFLTMLQFLKTGMNFDFGDILDALDDLHRNFMRNLIMNQLMALMTQIFERVMKPVRKWINDLGDGGTKIFECTPVKELVLQYLNAAALYAENYIKEMIVEWYRDIELKQVHIEMKLFMAGENKWLNQAIGLLNTIVRAMELSANCGLNDTPQSEPVSQLLSKINSSTTYIYPVEDNPNIYNSFITAEQQRQIEDIKLATGGRVNAYSDIVNKAEESNNKAIASRLDDCRKNIVLEDMPNPISWLPIATNNVGGTLR